jgi:phosphonate degradation associated HDIG domain protein
MALTLLDIERLFETRGGEQYSGEPVTQLQHALQTAALGEAEGASDVLVTAALLHDLGHMVHDLGETPSLRGVDDVHQYRALPFLRGLFDDAVLDAIKWHVDAKRYLCFANPAYHASLSADSKRSLGLQGGVFSAEQATSFMALAGAQDAVRLRRWDDLAKDAHRSTPTLAHFLARAQRCARTTAITTTKQPA